MPAWLTSILLSLLKQFGVPALIAGLTALENSYPGIKGLIDEIISILKAISGGAQASPSPALIAATKAFQAESMVTGSAPTTKTN